MLKKKSVLFYLFALVITAVLPAFGAGQWSAASWGGGDLFTMVQSNPADQNIVWALTLHGGVLKSEDGGSTWHLANGDLPGLDTVMLAPDPGKPQGAFLAKSQGLWYTADGGVHWTCLPGSASFSFTRLVSFKPILLTPSGKHLVVGTDQGGIHVSRDKGQTWTQVQWGNKESVRLLAGLSFRNRVLVALSESGGLYYLDLDKSVGPQFIKESPTFPILDLTVYPSYPESVYAACGRHGLWTASRRGEHWERVRIEPVPEDTNIRFLACCGSDEGSALVAWCGTFALRCRDGRRWEKFLDKVFYDEKNNPTRGWFARISLPTYMSGGPSVDRLFLSDYVSLYRTVNASGNAIWTEIIRGAGNQVIHDLAVDRQGTLFVAADRSGLVCTGDGGRTFSPVFPERYGKQAGEFTAVAVNPQGALVTASLGKWDGRVAAYFGDATSRKILDRSKGVDGDKLVLRHTPVYSGPWALAASPSEKGLFYLLVSRDPAQLYITRDSGRTWTRGYLPPGVLPGRAVALDKTREGYLFVGCQSGKGGVWMSRDYGRSWIRALETAQPVPALACGPDGAIFALGRRGTVWKSKTHGIRWRSMGDIGATDATALCVDPLDGRRVFAATRNAIYGSEPGTQGWRVAAVCPQTMPAISCLIKLPGEQHTLFAGTRGAGLWRVVPD